MIEAIAFSVPPGTGTTFRYLQHLRLLPMSKI